MQIKPIIISLILLLALNATPVLADQTKLSIDQTLVVKNDVAQGETWGTPSLEGQRLISELQKGGYVIYFRHTATEQKTEQWDEIDLQDCATQRNLSELGRQQGLKIGAAFTSLDIKVTKVVSSPFCRCVDTGSIAFGTVEISRDLLFSVGRDEVLEVALGKMLGTKPLTGSNNVLVSHSSNLRDTTGIEPKPEGVAVIFKPQDDGSFSYVAKVQPEEWDGFLRGK